MTVLLGQTTSGASTDFIFAGHSYAKKFTASATGSAATVSCQWKVANASISSVQLGIYTDDAANARPGTILGSGTVSPNPTGTGLFTATLGTPVSIVNGTAYWLAFTGTGEQIDWQGTVDATGLDQTTALPSPWGAGSGSTAASPVLYAEDAPAAGSYAPARPMLMKLWQPWSKSLFWPNPTWSPGGVTAQVFPQAMDATAVVVTASMVKQVGKPMTATSVVTSASMVRQVGKFLSATTVAVTAALAKQANKLLTATAVVVTASLVAMKVILKALTATAVVVTATLIKQVNKPLTATTVAVTASLRKQVNKILAATAVVVTATLSAIRVFLKTLTATAVVVTASMVRQTGKPMSATVALSASLVKQINKRLSATSTVTASLTALRVFLKALTATVTVTAAMSRQVAKGLVATVSVAATASKRVSKTLIATVTATASMLADPIIAGAVQVVGYFRSAAAGVLSSIPGLSRFQSNPGGDSSTNPDEGGFDPPKPGGQP